jgi:hypothetical protein
MTPEQLQVGKVVFSVAGVEGRPFIGRVKRTYAAGEYVSEVNKKPMMEPAVELETGDVLVATAKKIDGWSVLEPAHERFYADASGAVVQVVKALAGVAAALKIRPQLAFLIIGRLFQVQGGLLLRPSDEGEAETW